jgi:predicted TIM-barrel fold metal-dependent hydrolase
VRFTLQPVDAPLHEPEVLSRTIEHMTEQMGSDDFLLFSTDYPHWQFDGEDVLPAGLGQDTIRKMLIDNALDAYPRLREAVGGRSAEREETVS